MDMILRLYSNYLNKDHTMIIILVFFAISGLLIQVCHYFIIQTWLLNYIFTKIIKYYYFKTSFHLLTCLCFVWSYINYFIYFVLINPYPQLTMFIINIIYLYIFNTRTGKNIFTCKCYDMHILTQSITYIINLSMSSLCFRMLFLLICMLIGTFDILSTSRLLYKFHNMITCICLYINDQIYKLSLLYMDVIWRQSYYKFYQI